MKLTKKNIIAWTLCLSLLVGVSSSAFSDVLCIGDDGHVEYETICLPCCTDDSDSCDNETTEEQHAEHNECSNCSDVEIDNHLWTKRFHKIETKTLLISKYHHPVTIADINSSNIYTSPIKSFHSEKFSNQDQILISLSTVMLNC